jgi:hypothetical protein
MQLLFFEKIVLALFMETPEYFGERNGLWKVAEYEFKTILAGNYIDACAIYTKKFMD